MAVTAILSVILKNKVDHAGIGVPKMLCATIISKYLAVFRLAPDRLTCTQVFPLPTGYTLVLKGSTRNNSNRDTQQADLLMQTVVDTGEHRKNEQKGCHL